MVPRENKNNAYAKFWRENKEYYGSFESGLLIVNLHLSFPLCSISRGNVIGIALTRTQSLLDGKLLRASLKR